jgi:hypothetical protein
VTEPRIIVEGRRWDSELSWRWASWDRKQGRGTDGYIYDPEFGFRPRSVTEYDQLLTDYNALSKNANSVLIDVNGSVNIAWSFISELEGGQRLVAYALDGTLFPNSGITVATGFDLGQRSRSDLVALGLSASLIDKLEPYLGRRGVAAESYIAAYPLTLSSMEADQIDRLVKASVLETTIARYDAGDSVALFRQLPMPFQTVIASVAFQYGDLSRRTPAFWALVKSGNWQGAINELRDFGDSFSERRGKEADLMEVMLRGAVTEERLRLRALIDAGERDR